MQGQPPSLISEPLPNPQVVLEVCAAAAAGMGPHPHGQRGGALLPGHHAGLPRVWPAHPHRLHKRQGVQRAVRRCRAVLGAVAIAAGGHPGGHRGGGGTAQRFTHRRKTHGTPGTPLHFRCEVQTPLNNARWRSISNNYRWAQKAN